MSVHKNLKAPLISIVLLLDKDISSLSRALLSILNQTFQNIEIVVISNSSNNKSEIVSKEFDDKRIKHFTIQNQEKAYNKNYGISKTSGEYIAFMQANDEWRENHLEVLLKGFNLCEDVVLVCDDIVEVFDEKENISKEENPLECKINYNIIPNYLQILEMELFTLSLSSVLIKSDIIKNYNLLFQKEAIPAEDINYLIMLNSYGKFVYCDYLGGYTHKNNINKKSNELKLLADYFYKIDISLYNSKELSFVKKFIKKEYLKLAFENRGKAFEKEEFILNYHGLSLGFVSSLLYIFIRFSPKFLLKLFNQAQN